MKNHFFLFLLCISAPFIIAAQHNSNIEKKDSYVLTVYQNDAVFIRFDSITSPYIVPSIDIMMPPVFADAFILSDKSSENRIDLFLLTADSVLIQ
jgi:hypothetical protein